MSIAKWNEFLDKYVVTWRDQFSTKLSDIEQRKASTSWHRRYFFSKPCQIEVIDAIKPQRTVWLVTKDEDRKDMDFIVHLIGERSFGSFFAGKKNEDPMWFKKYERIIEEILIEEEEIDRGASLWGLYKARARNPTRQS